MGKHTPEPWETRKAKHPVDGEFDYAIGAEIDDQKHCIAEAFGRADYGVTLPAECNARRIVAAVNFCAGIETEQIEGVTLEEVVAELRELVETFKGYQGMELKRAQAILSHFDAGSTPAAPTTPTEEGDG